MDGSGFARMMADLIAGLVIGALVLGSAITLFFVYGVPWIWHALKPFLHRVTS